MGLILEKTTFADLVQMIRDDYAVNQRRSTRRLEDVAQGSRAALWVHAGL